MKITCGVEISNRVHPAISARNKTRYSVATLALCSNQKGSRSDKDVNLILLTHQNPKGMKYQVYGNIEKLFTKFISEGKATVRFKEPPHDLILSKADPLQLKGFIHAVGLTIVGRGSGKIHLSAIPKKVERPKQKLTITNRSEYPVLAGFPASLQWLQIQGCSLKRLDLRITKLRNLQVLDFSDNCLTELPVGLSQLKLKELILHHNELTSFPEEFSTGPLGQSLTVLDLSSNQISQLSPYFCLMENVCVLSLKENKLVKLPRNIHCLESLRKFSAASNQLKVLPFGIRRLHLDTLDLYDNPLNTHVALCPGTQWEEVPTLLECAASSIVENKIPLTKEALPSTLIDYIVNHCPCPCGKKVFQNVSFCTLVMDLFKLASTVVYINNTSRFKVPLEVYFCSDKCWRKSTGQK